MKVKSFSEIKEAARVAKEAPPLKEDLTVVKSRIYMNGNLYIPVSLHSATAIWAANDDGLNIEVSVTTDPRKQYVNVSSKYCRALCVNRGVNSIPILLEEDYPGCYRAFIPWEKEQPKE